MVLIKKMAVLEASQSSSGNRKDSGDLNIRGNKDATGKRVSDVWKHFVKSADRKKAVCTICDKLSYLGGTTNLRDHLEAKHALQYCATNKPTTGHTTTMDEFVRHTKCSEACAKNITDRVSQMIVQDLRPI